MSAKKIAQILLAQKAVTIRVQPPYVWASGIQSPIYCDNRLLLSAPEARRTIVAEFVKMLAREGWQPDSIAGTATAGIPWGALLAEKLGLPFVYVRKAAKDHGKGNQIEGRIGRGQKVVLVEDLISTGGSSLDCVAALKTAGAKMLGVAAIFSYHLPAATHNFHAAKTNYAALSNFQTLVEVAVAENYLPKKAEAAVKEWSHSPERWTPPAA